MTLQTIAAEVNACTRCKLHLARTRAVPGEGPANADILFIGEGPGFHEDQQGRPFVGAAGKFLEELLAMIGLKREQVFITNVVKCRPPGNRDPEADELAACDDYLERQIAALNPKVIVTLGRFSMAKFFPNAKISIIHGQARRVRGRLVVAMFHPAAALHQAKFKEPLIEDFKKLPALIAAEREASAAAGAPDAGPADDEPPAEQMSLF
ncbi:MAG: uracil-DNA glycosylase [Anaerolineales bacterium]|nr:uracil-DNA glycosylase [Anaerolineales bacterium]